MKENEGDEELMRSFAEEQSSEGAVTEEFNRFLEKRVEAVKKQ